VVLPIQFRRRFAMLAATSNEVAIWDMVNPQKTPKQLKSGLYQITSISNMRNISDIQILSILATPIPIHYYNGIYMYNPSTTF
jgi:hypothetical protein